MSHKACKYFSQALGWWYLQQLQYCSTAKQPCAATQVHLATRAYAQVANATSQSMLAAIDLLSALRSNATAALPGLSTAIGAFTLHSSDLDDALVIVSTGAVYNTYSGSPCVDYGRAH